MGVYMNYQLFLLSILSIIFLISGCAETVDDVGRKVVFVDAASVIDDSDGTSYAPYKSLGIAITNAQSGDEIFLYPGIYKADPSEYVDSLCGNCQDHQTLVFASVGYHIYNKNLYIRGKHKDSVVIVTNAGYGMLFEHSDGSIVSDVTITGGVRDLDGDATNAAVVVKYSDVTIENCNIINNDHMLDSVVVGIGGVFGRESSEIVIRGNRIENNGWDGVALYRGATARIVDNIINQGRGAGIGITWDAGAVVIRNRVSNYWKGIGTFGNSHAIVTNNFVFDNLGWGIIATGFSMMDCRNNVVTRNGNCGFACWSEDTRGFLKNNIIVNNGWKEEWVCPCVGVWMSGKLANFPVSYNNVWNNSAGDYKKMPEWNGLYGNLSVDPLFIDSLDFHLKQSSPLIKMGDPYYTNPDGSRSDMGGYGGQNAIF
jgi:Right handed beta helix region